MKHSTRIYRGASADIAVAHSVIIKYNTNRGMPCREIRCPACKVILERENHLEENSH